MHTLPGNVKLYYIGPMFRRERPQKGRYRQFYQIGAEVLGQSDAPAIDAEVLEMLLVFFKRVGLTKTTLYVNSIGCKECRPKYVELLREELLKVKDSLERTASGASRRIRCACSIRKCRRSKPMIETSAADFGSSLRGLPRAFCEAERGIESARHGVPGKLAAGARARLLHADDL